MSATQMATALSSCANVSVVHGRGDGKVTALDAVDLQVAADETLALWGRSGSGKTTLLHVLGGLVSPSSGRVTWREGPLSSLDAAARAALRARGIAYVFQGTNLLPYFTAYENVAFALRTSGAGTQAGPRPDQRLRRRFPVVPSPDELLGLVGLQDKLDALASELSGGEAQRVAIARALAQHPELMLCDEPTGQLDSDTAKRVLDLIDALQEEFSFALVVATHDADVAARYGRVVELSDGRIVADVRP
jgi:ABC-type lipoprotein export system ATPase subunit